MSSVSDVTTASSRRRNYKERYRRIVQSEWFKEAYDGMSVDFIRVDDGPPPKKKSAFFALGTKQKGGDPRNINKKGVSHEKGRCLLSVFFCLCVAFR